MSEERLEALGWPFGLSCRPLSLCEVPRVFFCTPLNNGRKFWRFLKSEGEIRLPFLVLASCWQSCDGNVELELFLDAVDE